MSSPEIQQLSGELSQLTRALQNMVAASSRTVSAQQAQFEHLLDVNEQLDDYNKSLTSGRKLSKAQQQLANEALRLKKLEIKAADDLQKAQNILTATMKKSRVSTEEIQRKQVDVARATKAHTEATIKESTARGALTDSLGKTNKGAMLANAGLVFFGKALLAQGKQMLAQNTAAGGMIEGQGSVLNTLAEQQTEALKRFAVTGAQYAEITAKNRQMINSMGGHNAAMGELTDTVRRFVIGTGGDFTKGLVMAAEAATNFAQKGIKPTASAMAAYTADIYQLQRQTGKSIEEATSYFNDMASDADTIELLRRARKDERAGILANQRALALHGQQLGMTAEQAKEAAKMLNKMSAAKPLDRLKQAAKIRAIGGALGVAGANEAADGVAAGPRATDNQKKAMQDFTVAMANRVDQAAQDGMASEIFATTLVDKLGLEEYFGAGNKFSTSLGDTLKPAFDDLSKVYTTVADTAEGNAVYQALMLKEQVMLLASGNHYAGLLVAGVAAIGGMMAGGKIAGLMGKVGGGIVDIGKNALGMGSKGAQVASAAPASKLGAAASKAGSILKHVGVAGAAVDMGAGLYNLSQGEAQTERPKGLEMLSPMKWGMFIGESVNQQFEKMAGASPGSWMYDKMNPEPTTPPPTKVNAGQPAELSAKALDSMGKLVDRKPTDIKLPKDELAERAADVRATIRDISSKTADAVTNQLKKMDASNDLLKQLTDTSKKQIEISEKQLKMMTMTEAERTSSATKTVIETGSRFQSGYAYL